MVLVAFDFDGTLSRDDLVQLLGKEYDVAGDVQGLTAQMNGQDEAVGKTIRRQVALLEGMPERRMERAFDRAKVRDGVPELIAALRRSGVTVAIITTSFERGVEHALTEAGVAVDHLVANRLVLQNGAVSRDVEGPLLTGTKGNILQELAATEGISLEETIAVGNGVTDRSMLQVAGTSIGFLPNEDVERRCDTVVTSIRKLHLYFEQHGIVDSTDR